MARIPARYQHHGVLLVRTSTDPGDLDLPVHLDLDNLSAIAHDGRAWLGKLWSRDEVREALSMASPDLAARIDQILDRDACPVAARDVRRAVLSTAAYLLRWQRRPTPFGMFAGVDVAVIGRAAGSVGERHAVVAHADGEWLTGLIDQIERHPRLRNHLTVVADSAGFVRDGRFVVAARAEPAARTPGPLLEASVRYTRPVQVALAAASSPIRFDALAAQLADRFPGTRSEKIYTMLHGLVDQGILITSLRPPMTATDGLGHVVDALRAAGAERLPDPDLPARLEEIRSLLERHNTCPDQQQAAHMRAYATERMNTLTADAGQPLAVDTRLDSSIAVPKNVVEEAGQAATVLLRLTTKPFGSAAWLDYHSAFRTRYGPGALVPVRELVADSGLGYPGGYLGAQASRRAWRMLTDRDTTLLAMIQRAALDDAGEIVLTDADVEALTVGDHENIVPPQRIEMGATIHAVSAEAIDRGEFKLWITATPKTYTSMAGRFAHLLDETDQAQLAASYTIPPDETDPAIAVQLSFPPRRRHNQNVVRVPPLLPDVVCLSEHPDDDVIDVDDLAVTADADQMYLIQRSTGRRVVPRILHALDTTFQSPPLARFLAEVADARTAVFGPFDFGVARTLPHTPRIRYQRTVLAPARWTLSTTDLPTCATGQDWDTALAAWRQRWRVPPRVVACHGELHLPLDLDQPLERTLLRTRLERAGRLEVREDAPPDGSSWVARPAELLIPMTAITPPPRPRPVTTAPGAVLRPGGEVVHAQLVGNPARFDDLLTRHLPALVDQMLPLGVQRWWARRNRDLSRPEADQHLALLLRLESPDSYGPVAARLARFAAHLQARGLPADLTLASYAQHPGRYGNGPALLAAEHVFAADTQAAVAQITMAEAAGIPGQALAAASMAQLAAEFAPDPPSGYRALLGCLPRQAGQVDRRLSDLARHLSNPTADFQAIRTLPGGEQVAAAWQARDEALRAYHHTLAAQRDPATVLRTLLHEHHVRALGVDAEFEKTTGRLARAAAMRRLAPDGTQ